jgi:lipid-binding SYLF domain-containing protein
MGSIKMLFTYKKIHITKEELFMKIYVLRFVVALCLIFGPALAKAADEPAKEGGTTESTGKDATQEDAKKDPKKEEKRRAIMDMRDRTLEQLYKTNPEAKADVENAVGYAVFDATGVNVILVVGVKGKGIAVENSSKKVTYMDMVRAGSGPGIGYKDYRMVFVFTNKKVFDTFTTMGMDAGASADATMKMGGKGSEAAYAKSFNPYVKVYQITDKGLLLQANWGEQSS